MAAIGTVTVNIKPDLTEAYKAIGEADGMINALEVRIAKLEKQIKEIEKASDKRLTERLLMRV